MTDKAQVTRDPRIARWSCIVSGMIWAATAAGAARFLSPDAALIFVAFGVGYITDREAQRHGK